VIGTTEKIYLDDCRDLGQSLIETLVSGMEPKGYKFGRRTLVSVDNVVDPKLQYRILRTWEQHTEDSAKFPLMPPPSTRTRLSRRRRRRARRGDRS
jgi:hypothetical protein